MESKTMACKKCTEELGVYATSFQHGCYECWKLLQETIKSKDAEIERVKESNLIAEMLIDNKDKAIAEARELINVALKITEERSFWIKDEFIMESEQVEEWREKAKAWLEQNK